MALNPKITNWRGKRVWLVGASAGIGAALAQELSKRGAILALSARSEPALQALALPGALVLPCDATDAAHLASIAAQLHHTWGQIDLVIDLAGNYVPMRAPHFDLAVAEQVVTVNFTAAMRLSAAVLPYLTAGGGIAFVASVAGYRGLPQALCYGPGKAALIHFAECLYLDVSAQGIGVWVINPGFVETRLTAQNHFKMPALISSQTAALATLKGLASGQFEIHYPKRFTRVMKLLSLLPYRWYFALVRRFTGL